MKEFVEELGLEKPFNIGERIRSYQIEREIGEGGMGIVYLATDLKIGRKVAIKVIIDRENAINMKRFMREAEAVAALDHPNIIKMYAFFKFKEAPCMVMEFVNGKTLEDCLAEQILSLKDKVYIAIKALHALSYAHKQGIVHRDIKPSNIMVNENREPLVMDFGLAKSTRIQDKSLTKTGTVMGSCGYMAPEQACGLIRQINHTSDVYGIGAVLYKLVTDHEHIVAEHMIEYMYNLMHQQIIPPRQHNKEVSRPLETIILKALERKQHYRYQSAIDFANDLNNYLEDKPISAQRWRMSLRRNSKWIMAAITLSLCAAFMASYFFLSSKNDHKINEWIKRGFFENAAQRLQDLRQQNKISKEEYLESMLVVHSKLKNVAGFDEIRQQISKNSPKVTLAEGEILLHMKQQQKAQKKFDQLLAGKPCFEQMYAAYFTGKSYFAQKDYQTGVIYLKKVIELYEKYTVFTEITHTYFYLGKYYFEKKDYTLAQEYLQKAQLSENPNWHEMLGKCYMHKKSYAKAQQHFEKCISLENNKCNYHVWLGKSLLSQDKITEANKNFEKALDIDPRDVEALQWFTRVALSNIDLMEYRYFYFIYLRKFYPPKSLTYELCDALAKKHSNTYWKYTKAFNAKAQNSDITGFVKRLDHKDAKISFAAHEALQLFRYNTFLYDALKNKPRIARSFRDMCQQETREALMYMMAKSAMKPNSDILKSLSVKQLRSVIENEKDHFLQYLAIHCLILKHRFLLVEKIRCTTTDKNLQLICAHVLAKYRLYTDNSSSQIPDYTNTPFMNYVTTGVHPFYNNIGLCEKFFKNTDLANIDAKTKLAALTTYSNQMKLHKKPFHNKIKLIQQVSSKFTPFFENPSTTIASNAHSVYWHISRGKSLNAWLKDNFLKNLHADVINVVLQAARHRAQPTDKSILDHIIKHYPPFIQRLALRRIAEKQIHLMEQYLRDKSLDPATRASSIYMFLRNRAIKAKQFLKPDIEFILKSPEPFLRSYAYSIAAAYGDEILDYLDKEHDVNIKIALMRSSTLPLLPLVSINKRKQYRERQKIVQRYFRHKNPKVRRESYRSFTYYANSEKQIDEIYTQYKNDRDPAVRSGVAAAIRHKMRDIIERGNLRTNMKYFAQHSNFKNRLQVHRNFKSSLKPRQIRNKYKKMLQQIKSLKTLVAEDYVRWGLIAKQEEQWQTAIEKLNAAIATRSFKDRFNELICLVELSECYMKIQQKIPNKLINSILRILKKDSFPEEIFVNFVQEKNTPAVEKILLQYYLSQCKSVLGFDHNTRRRAACLYLIQYYQQYRRQRPYRQKRKMFAAILENTPWE
ncbi:serine/threonine-protein kinase [Candidatus Uabimicrobium amorphum]|uniref:Protein kinase n=1 Tax=Uabimicrobium amorphum TaxID=2596890 RepID=A0A5S9IQ23_UABAM|nr:serine/threonine-protein kinase [Candidatus Uabimicrobium amorphum]BBM86003.1 protein kinase [Candidatus Uabimicrobium amorphum]